MSDSSILSDAPLLSLVVITKDEADRIGKLLDSASIADEVVVVEDECEGVGNPGEVVDQCSEDRFRAERLRRTKQGQAVIDRARMKRLDRCDDVRQEQSQVVVSRIERHPGHTGMAVINPFAQQSGFAEAGRRGNEREPPPEAQPVVEPLDQPWARDPLRAQRRQVKLGRQE